MTRRGLLGFLSGVGASAVIPVSKATVKRTEVKLAEPEEYFVSQAFGKIPIPKGTITDIHRDIKRICEEARKEEDQIDLRNDKLSEAQQKYWKDRVWSKFND